MLISCRSCSKAAFSRLALGGRSPFGQISPKRRTRSWPSGVEEFVPLLDDVIVFVRPLVPVGNVGGAGFERTAVAQITFLDAALGRALPGLSLIPERVFVGGEDALDGRGGRIIALLGDRDAGLAGQPVI